MGATIQKGGPYIGPTRSSLGKAPAVIFAPRPKNTVSIDLRAHSIAELEERTSL